MIRFISISFLLISLTGCKDQYFEIDKDPLKGEIEGDTWVYGSGRIRYDQFYVQGLTGIIFQETLNDPCTRVSTVDHHISLSIPYDKGNFNLPFAVPNYYVVFSIDGITEYTANTGFIEIVAVTPTEVIGYLSASFDDDNHAQGSFSLRLCD
ncbi:MAG: hypothetical protein ACFHWX_19545 [Bacteroidota bacterium]